MKQINEEFAVPYYLFEEIVEYVELTAKGYSKCMKWNNIKALLRLAIVNNGLTEEQAKFLGNKFNREWNLQKITIYDKKYCYFI